MTVQQTEGEKIEMIIIPWINKPKDCSECVLKKSENECCPINGYPIENDQPYYECPIKQVEGEIITSCSAAG